MLKKRVEKALEKAGRKGEEVKIVAVSKTFPPESVRALYSLGHKDFGENYVQEARKKVKELSLENAEWHMVGKLQKNKVKYIPETFQWFHALDSVELAELLEKKLREKSKTLKVLIQVKYEEGEHRVGVEESDIKALIEKCLSCEHIKLRGLMVLPPIPEHPEDSRPYFQRLRRLRDSLLDAGFPEDSLKELSMGMSDDFEVAIEEGATIIRVGRIIFGERRYE